ncbi:MAG: TonB-dependent receptor [Rhodothalassiaceae bacterium]
MNGRNWRTALLGGASLLVFTTPGAGAQALDGASGARDAMPGTPAPIIVADAAAQAQQSQQQASATSDEEGDVEEIIVRGFRPSIERAIDLKRRSSSIIEAISAEDIGKLPDVSIGETLARLPGLTAQRLDGRAQVISVRGLGPDFSTALLNGREQVTTSDNRGIEFDQYPAELLGGVVVYKTPDATLIGQGLAGTVDLRTIRPLEHGQRSFTANARGEFNEDGSLNPDAPGKGFRASATYIDQFADDTVGVTLGIASQSTPTQIEQFNSWGFPTLSDGSAIIGGSKPFVKSDDLDRIGVLGTLEYQPSASLHSILDVSYSHFDETQRLRGIEFPLFWSSAQLRPGFTVENGLVTKGVFDGVKGVMRNDRNDRNADLVNIGWNLHYDINEDWAVESDISYSRSDRKDRLLESYTGTGPAGVGATDSLGFEQLPNGVFTYTPTLDYSDTNLFVLTDPQGWGGGAQPNPVTQAGFINAPKTSDELTHLRLAAERAIGHGIMDRLTTGVDISRRDKKRRIAQDFLTLGGATSLPIPQEALLKKTTGLKFLGIPSQVTYDPLFLLDNVYTKVPIQLSSFNVPQDWMVREDVLVAFTKLDLDGEVGGMALNGNVGLQAVYTDQSSEGFRVRGAEIGAGTSEGGFVPVRDGDKYWKFLPSLNLILHLDDASQIRFGAARTLARARMDQLNAGLALSANFTRLTSTDPNQSFFSAGGGNARLKPTISNQIDLSLEHYFADGTGYIAVAGFYKDLQDFINPNDAFLFDFSAFIPDFLTPEQQQMLGTPLGIISGPTNNGRGNIRGVEATLSLPFELLSEPLEGFGVIISGSYTDSKVTLGDNPDPITVPGLSKWVVNTTVYYEKSGFQARISQRYRTKFLGEVAGISATRILRTVKGESVFDAQLSYTFEEGVLEGLTILAQANNITNERFATFQEPDRRLVIDHQSFGRTYLFGASYSF